MANRFTATEKWADPWFCELNNEDKLFWIYLVDNCDHAGLWQVNWPLVKFHIKDYVFNEKAFNGRIVRLKENKWFIPKFIEFQYKTGLNPDNRAHASVLEILKKEGALKGLERSSKGRKDMDKDKDKDKEETGGAGGFEDVWSRYPSKLGMKVAKGHYNASVKTQQDFIDIHKALDNYLKSERVLKGFIMNGSTWFNNWREWLDFKEASKPIENTQLLQEAIAQLSKMAKKESVASWLGRLPKEQHSKLKSFLVKTYKDGEVVYNDGEELLLKRQYSP